MTRTPPVTRAIAATPPTPKLGWLFGRWSAPAAMRAMEAAVILPALLAITFNVVGDPQMASYAAFGTFANLVLASFSGTRRDKVVAHIGLGLAGSALLSIGTAVHAATAVAAPVSLLVTFAVLLAGATGANVAAGGLAAMLSYVLAAASPGTTAMIPSRLEGWWLATAAAGLATALTTGRPAGDQLRAKAAATARALASETAGIAAGRADRSARTESLAAAERLRSAFNGLPYGPTGLATTDQALGNLIELLEWLSSLVDDTVAAQAHIGSFGSGDRELLSCAGEVLDAVARMLTGEKIAPDTDRLERLRLARALAVRQPEGDGAAFEAAVHASYHSRTVALAVRSIAADALIVTGRASAAALAQQRLAWLPAASGGGLNGSAAGTAAAHPVHTLASVVAPTVVRHASVRSIWVRNSLRGAVAVTAAVTVADLTNVQHGFWVVLGTLAVLRTTATATGGTAVRAVGGTTFGFLVGAGLLLLVGTSTTVLWIVLPVAVLVAAYVPGVAPFAAGQAAFTILLVLLYNLLLPVGWKVGVIRLEDIGLGCAISLLVGALVWPRGAVSVVADDLEDAFVTSGDYLTQAVEYALGLRVAVPDAGRAAVVAGLRVEDALSAFFTEQGTKSVRKEDLWALANAAQRLRLTAASLAELPPPASAGPVGEALAERARALAHWFELAASYLEQREPALLSTLVPLAPLAPLAPIQAIGEAGGAAAHRKGCQIYVHQHLRHAYLHHGEVVEPATRLGIAVQQPWWRRTAAGAT